MRVHRALLRVFNRLRTPPKNAAPCSLPPQAPLPFAPSTPPPQYVPKRNGCGCSIVQKVDSSDAWDAFQKCQETKGAADFKVLQDARCKPGQAKGPC